MFQPSQYIMVSRAFVSPFVLYELYGELITPQKKLYVELFEPKNKYWGLLMPAWTQEKMAKLIKFIFLVGRGDG